MFDRGVRENIGSPAGSNANQEAQEVHSENKGSHRIRCVRLEIAADLP